jgi:hypothetical protein
MYLRVSHGHHYLASNMNRQIVPHQSVNISFRSLSTQQITTEHLRCSPDYYKRPRYDTCLVKLPTGKYTFARAKYLFSCKAGGRAWDLAFITTFTTKKGPNASVTGMRSVQEDTKSCFIKASWIERSVLLTRDYKFNNPSHFFVNDLIDKESASDTFLRLRLIQNVQ